MRVCLRHVENFPAFNETFRPIMQSEKVTRTRTGGIVLAAIMALLFNLLFNGHVRSARGQDEAMTARRQT